MSDQDKRETLAETQEETSLENQKGEEVTNTENQQDQENQEVKEVPKTEIKEDIPLERRKSDPFGSENFIARVESKIQESETLHNELVKNKYENLKSDIKGYFDRLRDSMVKQIDETKDSVLSKVETIIEKETGFIDWDKFKAELVKKKEDYENSKDIDSQKKAFDEYFNCYNNTMKKVDAVNSLAYNRIDSTSKLFKFDEIVLDSFLVKLKSLCTILESDFITNVSFTANHLDPSKVRLEELVQIPHPGVWCAAENIDKHDVFVLGGTEGRISMYDSKTLRVIDVVQGLKAFVSCLLYIPQLSLLLIGGADSQVAVRRIEGRNLGKHLCYMEAEGFVTFIQYIEDENLIVTIGTDPNIRLYHPTSLVLLGKISTSRPGSKPRGGSYYFKDKKLLVVGFDDGMLHFYNMKQRKLAYAIFIDGISYWGLNYHEPTQRLYAHTSQNLVKVWDLKGERPVDLNSIILEGEGEKPFNIKVVDKYLFSANCSEKIIVYDVEERKVVKKIEVPSMKCQGILTLEKEGRLIISDEESAKVASIRYL